MVSMLYLLLCTVSVVLNLYVCFKVADHGRKIETYILRRSRGIYNRPDKFLRAGVTLEQLDVIHDKVVKLGAVLYAHGYIMSTVNLLLLIFFLLTRPLIVVPMATYLFLVVEALLFGRYVFYLLRNHVDSVTSTADQWKSV